MRRFRYLGPGLLLAFAAVPIVRAQTSTPAVAEPVVEPEAIAALDKMGAYLRTLKAFQVPATTTTEDVLTDGEKAQFASVADVLVRKPDRFRAEVNSDRHTRLFLYDGKEFTLFARRVGYYATVPAPPTIAEVRDRLDEKYGIELPLADLFQWGSPQWNSSDIKAASDIGPSEVEGVTCEHYALRQAGIDWQIWIQYGDYALPRKLIITTLTDEARPQFTAVYTWNLAPSFNDAAFRFVPSSDAKRIVFAEGSTASAAPKR